MPPPLIKPQTRNEDSKGSSRQSESDAYFISLEDPIVIADKLNASWAKLIGGRTIESLRFESGKRENQFLTEAGGSFCFPLMEKELMKSGMPNMLCYAKDLAMKTYITARCAAHQLEAEGSPSSQIATLEEKITKLEEEKAALE